jgi:hypothetical protein
LIERAYPRLGSACNASHLSAKDFQTAPDWWPYLLFCEENMKNTLNETRLDRIERNLESFFIGMQELKESQKRTDAQLNRTDKPLNWTDKPLNRTDKPLNRTDRQLQKTIKKLDDIGERLRDMGFVQDEVDE